MLPITVRNQEKFEVCGTCKQLDKTSEKLVN